MRLRASQSRLGHEEETSSFEWVGPLGEACASLQLRWGGRLTDSMRGGRFVAPKGVEARLKASFLNNG